MSVGVALHSELIHVIRCDSKLLKAYFESILALVAHGAVMGIEQ
jgi:hypothetical protein